MSFTPPDRDPAYLWDMLQHASQVQKFAQNLTFEQYQQDEMRRLAIERLLEVIGEAARKVSSRFQQAHPEIPWRAITAQRIVLAHLYHKIDHQKIWDVATTKIPELINLLQPLIPPLPPPVDE
jgi:uncharacterized protein with HEPN domain